MKTKYGDMNDDLFRKYFDRLVSKVFKLLPLKEEDNPTLQLYLESLICEIVGGKKFVYDFQNNPEYLSLIMSLESLTEIDKIELYKRKVFECISIIKKLQDGNY